MQGKLIIIDGTDGSGKTTQTEKLYRRLLEENLEVRKIKFPDYESDSSALVRMYLSGKLGEAQSVNPYAAAAFYAVDRYVSHKLKWKDYIDKGGIIIADRYTTSNMIHQAGKIVDCRQKEKFLEWLDHFEFTLLNLPRPDGVVFLDMPPQKSTGLVKKRHKQVEGSLDVHERDLEHSNMAYATACKVASQYGWYRIKCTDEKGVREIDEINDDIYLIVKKIITSK